MLLHIKIPIALVIPDRRLTLAEPITQFKLAGRLKRVACRTVFLTQQPCHVYNTLILLYKFTILD